MERLGAMLDPYTPSASRPATRPRSEEFEPESPFEAMKQDLQDAANRFQLEVVALERRCIKTLAAADDTTQECIVRVRACTRRLEHREAEWEKEKLTLRTELRSIYARYAKTQDNASPPRAASPDHSSDVVQEYSKIIYSQEATIRRLEDELSAVRREQDETTTNTLGLVGALEVILMDDKRGGALSPRAAPPEFEDMRKRALERLSAFKQAPWQARSRPSSQPGPVSSRPSSWMPYSPANGRIMSSSSAHGTSEVDASQLQASARRTADLIDQLTKMVHRLNENDHLKIFEDVGKSSNGARRKTTVGLVLGKDCVVDLIVTGGPAFNSREFSIGDRIVAVDGTPVQNDNVHALMLGSDVVGSVVKVSVIKKGSTADTIIKLTRADAEQIADRLEMMELFARLKAQVQRAAVGNAAYETGSMLDRLMFAYSRSLSSIADTERRVRANLFKLEQKERVSYGEILQGLDKLMTMQKTQEDVAARAIQSLDARCADLHREMDARCADLHREMEEKVQQEREVAARAIDSRCADLNREMEEKVQQEREKAQQQSSRMQAETDALFARLNDLTQMVQQLSGVLEESNASNRSLTADKDELESKFQSSEREKMEMQDTLERALERLTQENDNLNEGISKQASEILQLQRALQALDQQLQDALHALDKMTALFNASTAELVQLQAESADTIKKLHDERSLLCDERSLLSDERSLLLKRVEELEANHRAVGIRAQLAEDQVRDLTATLNSLKTERDTLQHQKATMLEELKENYRQVRQETADAQLKYEVREAKLRAELEASGAETGQLLIKILELERMQQELLSVLVPVEMTVTLEMDFAATGVEGTASRQKFETLFRQDMSNSTGIPLESIKIINMAAGSVLVDVQLETDSSKSPDAFSAALSLKRQVGDAASPLRTGGLTRSCVDITIKDKKTTMANIERLEKTLIDKEKSLSLAQHEIENLIKGLEQEQQKATDLESQLIEANKHIEMNYMNLEKQENTLKELRGTLEAAGKEITKLKEELEKNITENTILKHKVQTDQSDLLSKISRIDELEGALQETTRRLELHMAQSAAEQEAIDSLEKRLTSANAGIQTLTHQLSEEQTAHESLRAQYRELEATKEMEMNAAKAALNESKQESLKLEKEVSKLQLELHDSQAQVAELWRKVNTLQNEVNSTKKQLAVQKEMSDLANVIYGNIAEMDAALKVLSNELLEEQKFRIQETEKWKSQAVEETALHRTAVDELAAVQFLNGQTTASMSATIKNLEFEIEELTEENNLYKNKVDEVLGHVSKHEISKQALEREKRELQSDYNSHVRQMEQIKDRLDYINREKMETHAELEREKAARSALKAECDKLRGDLASNIELLSAEAASNLARSQEIIMLNQEVARLKAECAKLREVLFSKEERLSAETASNLASAQEIIMLNEELGRLKVSELAADRQGEIVRLESELDENTMELEVLTEQLKAMTDAHLSNKTKISELESTKHELLRDLSSLKMHQQEEINLRHQLADSKREIQQLNVKIQGLEGEVQDLQTAKTSLQTDLDRTIVQLSLEEETQVREKRQLEEERNRLQLDVKDMEVELKAFKVLLKEQRAAVELVYSVIDRAPQDSAGFALEPHMNADGFPVISKIDPLGSAAMSLEVHVGDIITLVDGHSVQDRHIDDVIKSLEGPIGSHVIIQARHPAGDQAPYVVSLARGAQNHSLCIPGSGDDDVNTNGRGAEDRKAVRERSAFVMKMAEKSLRYVCHLAYENSQAKRVLVTFKSLNPDMENSKLDISRSPFLKELTAATDAVSSFRRNYEAWQNKHVSLESKEDMFSAFVAFQIILRDQPFADSRFAAQVKLHEHLKRYARTPEDVLLSFLSLHPAAPFHIR